MPQIQVGLDKWLEGQTTHPSIVTRIHALGAEKPAPSRTLMIPAGPTAATVAVDLPVGQYLFEAFLPSGEVAAETVSVRASANEPVLLRASHSPHEWLSWQHLVGQADPWSPLVLDAVADAIELDVVTGADSPGALPKALLEVWKGAPVGSLKWTPIGVPPRSDGGPPRIDGRRTAYLFSQGPWLRESRYYGLVPRPAAGPPLLAVLPLPWPQADMNGAAAVDVLVDAGEAQAEGHREWPVRVSVVVRDNLMGSVFGYLGAGDLSAAARVVEAAVDLLYGKVQNPLAAAGGAYILVRSALTPRQRPAWVPWLQNLRNWFPWLPDGAILDGWAHLDGIGRPANPKLAAAAFVEAVQRGLPFYSAGVRLLFEGLTRVEATLKKADRPAGLASAVDFARRLALRVDVRQPFTVIRLR